MAAIDIALDIGALGREGKSVGNMAVVTGLMIFLFERFNAKSHHVRPVVSEEPCGRDRRASEN